MGFLSYDELARMNEREIYEFSSRTNIENWYEELKDFTIETQFIELDKETIEILIKAIEYNEKSRIFPLPIKLAVDKLTQTIHKSIHHFKKAFIRISTRSPKDSPLAIQKGKNKYAKEISQAETDGNENLKNLFLIKAQKYGMCVESGNEAMNLLLSSTRIKDDLGEALEFSFMPKVIIRKWVEIPEWAEFRGFVDKQELVGLSQYFYYCQFDEVIKNHDSILNNIQEFFSVIKKSPYLVQTQSYILDFALLESTKKVILLELNPYFVGTDSCLFSWKKDTFENFEFRFMNTGR